MKHTGKNTRILIAVALIALVALPVTIFLAGRPATNRSDAASGTSLLFDPAATQDQPEEIATGDDLSLDMQLEPGENNVVTFVKFVIDYDPEIFDVAEEDFTPNEDSFPELLEGPTIENGQITGSLSVGSDPTLAITGPTSLGEITFHAKKSTGDTPTTIAYSADSEVLSIGEADNLNENVLTITGATVVIVGESDGTEDAEEEPTDEVSEEGTGISFSALLHGIGSAGDSTNPQNNSLSNKKPIYDTRPTLVAILDENGEDIARTEGDLLYDEKTGKFAGSFTMDTFVPDGTYSILILADSYLPFEKDIEITGESVDIGEISLVAGDIIPDGTLDILDYNALSDCGYGSGNPLPMDNPESAFMSETCQKNEYAAYADLDDNGIIDIRDFNLFLRELSAQSKK
jgi:hypothetical protein